jgi:hypothetical protein
VQEAACTCLALLLQELFKKSQLNLAFLTHDILQVLLHQAKKMKGSALTSLFDCLSVLSQAPNFKEHSEVALSILQVHWAQIKNGERRFLPLLECFTECVRALQEKSELVKTPVFERCVQIFQQGGDMDFAQQALNLIGELCQACDCSELIQKTGLLKGLEQSSTELR